jgi:hypothetical protein
MLSSWFDIIHTFAGYTPETPDWKKDKYITIVARLRNDS